MADEYESLQGQLHQLQARLSEQESLVEELRTGHGRGGRRVVLNAAMMALVLLLATVGTAGALTGKNTVFSDDITNGDVKRADLDANAVNGVKVADGSISGADVKEGTFDLGSFFAAGTAHQYYCAPASGAQTCVSVELDLAKAGKVLINGSGLVGAHTAGFAHMQIHVDGVARPPRAAFDSLTRENWSLTDMVQLSAGSHTISLVFTQSSNGNLDAYDTTLTVAQVSS